MLYIVGIENCKCVCHKYSVVSAERCAVCGQEITVANDLNADLFHIDVSSVLDCRHHIGVPLYNDGRLSFIAWGRILFYNNVIIAVAYIFKSVPLCKGNKIIRDRRGVSRGVGYICYLFKIFKYPCSFFTVFYIRHYNLHSVANSDHSVNA